MGLFITMLLVAVTVGYYQTRVALPPRLIYQDNEANRQSVASIPALTQRYSPTPWLANTHLQLIFLGLKKAFGRRLQYDSHDILTMADGGTTALYWLGESLPEQTPTLLVLHTITGSPHSMRGLVRDLQLRTGWRVVVCTRRGHAELPLTAPRINTLGDTADLREQLAVITQRYPHSPLYAVGISAGSGLLVRYLGEEGHNTPIQGAMAYCPGYNVEVAFLRSRPPYNRMMARKLARTFVTPYADQFSTKPGYQQCAQANDLQSFHEHIHALAGYPSQSAYLEACNPVGVMKGIVTPMLILNAEDDPVCVIENADEHIPLIRQLPHAILAITRRGSHCAYFSGWRPRSWANAVMADYFMHLNQQRQATAPLNH